MIKFEKKLCTLLISLMGLNYPMSTLAQDKVLDEKLRERTGIRNGRPRFGVPLRAAG